MKLVDLFPKSMMLLDLKAKDKRGAIRECLQHLVAKGKLTEDTAKKAERSVHRRESQGSTGIGKGLAIPHSKNCPSMKGILGVFGRSLEGVQFDSVDGELVKVLFLVISSEDHADEHLGVLKKVATLHRDEKTLRFLATTAESDSVLDIFKELDDGHAG